MNKIIKFFIFTLIILINTNECFALSTGKIDKLIKNSQLNETSTISISVKNLENGNTEYEYNSKKYLHPASTLKIFTTYAALNVLGYDYTFKTGFYKDSNNNLYIKLGADPLLTTAQLNEAFSQLKTFSSFENLYFDDSIIDKKEFSTGWMWDDDVNPYTPKVSAYNLDKNIITATLVKNSDNIKIENNSQYPMTLINLMSLNNNKEYIEMNRYNWNTPEVTEISGSVMNTIKIAIPLSSMRRYFIYTIEKLLDTNNIKINSTLYASKITPNDATLIYEIKNPINLIIPEILQNSNNLMAETVFKLSGGKKYNSTASEQLAINNFNEFYNSIGIDTHNIIIKDGSGVSRNNLVYTDWITTALNKLYKLQEFKRYSEYMAQPGDGTLSKRLYDLRGEARLKTGSLSNVSGIIGYVKSKDGKTYSVAILIQNFTKPNSEIKTFEDDIIKLIYNQ